MIEFNNSQRLGLDLDRHIALDAGAGTGKTTGKVQTKALAVVELDHQKSPPE